MTFPSNQNAGELVIKSVFREAVATRMQKKSVTELLAASFNDTSSSSGGAAPVPKVALASDDFDVVADIPAAALANFGPDDEVEVGSVEPSDVTSAEESVIGADGDVFYFTLGADLAEPVSVTFSNPCVGDGDLGKPLLRATSADDNDWPG